MRVFAVSDVHIDYEDNRRWLSGLSSVDFVDDVLLLAGDLTDDTMLLEQCFRELSSKFLHVFYVPGNHELWVRKDALRCSFDKFEKVRSLAHKCGIHTQSKSIGGLSIVPLFSWYDFSFAQPCERLTSTWMDFVSCKWPNDFTVQDVNRSFLEMNQENLHIDNEYIISFSHFLPRIDLMPSYIPTQYHYVYPVLGSALLDRQVRELGSDLHVYGHSHVNNHVCIDGIEYINNAFAYPTEKMISRKQLLCVYRQNR